MCGLCENARLRAGLPVAGLDDPTGAPFQPLVAAFIDPFESGNLSQIVAGPGAPALLTGTAADAGVVASILARIAQVRPPEITPIPVLPEPAQPNAPAAPTTDVSRIGTAAYDFIDITTSQRVRIETRGGDDFIRFGNGSSGPEISAVVIGAEGRESIEGRGARLVARFELGGGVDNIYGTFAAGSAIIALLGSGNDVARLNTGTNHLDGGADNDNLTGGNGVDTLIGGDGSDTLYGESFTSFDVPEPGGNDLLLGGIGNDTLYGAGGDDQLSGGDGDDTVFGMWGNDLLWGGAGADRLQGGTGNDVLRGGAGADTLFGEADNDQLDGGDGDDQIFGGDGDDLLTDASGNDRLNGGIGNDRIRGGAGNNIIEGDAGDDILIAEAGDDTVYGGAGNDTLVGGPGNDQLFAGDGNDILLDGDGNDRLDGNAGDDVLVASAGDDTLSGSAGRDTLIAGEGTDRLDGGDDDDVLVDFAGGTATLVGGNGNDIFIITSARTVVQEFSNQGTDDVAYVYVNGWLPPSGIERVIYMDGAAPPSDAVLSLHATSLRPAPGTTTTFRYMFVDAPFNQSKTGTSLFQGLYLPEGQSLQMVPTDQNLRLAFRQAADEFERIANIRFVEVINLAEADFAIGSHNMTFGGYAGLGLQPGNTSIQPYMISSGIQTSGLVKGGFGYSTMVHELGHIVGLKHPFEGAFQLAGADADNGRFSLMSYGRGKSNDGLMIFDIEATRFIYGAKAVATGNDVYRFDLANRYHAGLVDDGGIDLVDLSGSANGATLDLGAGNFSTVNVSLNNLANFSRNLGIANGTTIENAVGTRFADRITGNAADNRIEGGAGDDVLDGGDGVDTAVYATASAAVTVNLGLATAQNTLGAGSDTLGNFENLQGSAFNDTLIGNGLANSFEGGAGNDVIDGAGGIDTAVYVTPRQSITFVRNGDGSVSITAGSEGSDRLMGIEQIQFAGTMFALSRFDTAGIRLANFAVGAGGWISQDRLPRQMADVNGDGLADIVGFGTAGTLVALGQANGSFAAPILTLANFGQDQGWSSNNIFRRELADVNGDGRDDIVGFGTAGVLVSLAQANGNFGAASLASTNFNPANGWTSQDGFARTLADVNGDGLADIIGFGTPGTFVALGTGAGSFSAATFALANFGTNQGWASNNVFHREVGDVNGDGLADIVGFGTAGTLVALGQANGTFGAATFALGNFGTNQGWSTQDVFTRDLADVNGDGRDDIVGFGIAGTFVAYGQANGLFSSASFDLANFGRDQGWSSDNVFHRELADVNGDGRADIIGFGQSGVFAAIAFDGQVI